MANDESQLMQVFSAAFQKFILQEDEDGKNKYENLFEKYMGKRWAAPIDTKTYEFPKYSQLEKSNSPIVTGCVRIGTYDHAPYCYTQEDGSWTGWEYEIAEAVREIIYREYSDDLKGLNFEWVAAPIDESILPMNGADNDIIKEILVEGLRNGSYHMVYSGTLLKNEGVAPGQGGGADASKSSNEEEEEVPYVFACPTSNFYVSAVYSGRGEFEYIPTGSAERMLSFLGGKSKETPIRIIHTANEGQSDIAANVGSWITEQYGGSVSDWDVFIPSLFSLIEQGDTHLYVGDCLQIMLLAMDKEKFPNIQNLEIDFGSLGIHGASGVNSPDDGEDKGMLLAPYALATT